MCQYYPWAFNGIQDEEFALTRAPGGYLYSGLAARRRRPHRDARRDERPGRGRVRRRGRRAAGRVPARRHGRRALAEGRRRHGGHDRGRRVRAPRRRDRDREERRAHGLRRHGPDGAGVHRGAARVAGLRDDVARWPPWPRASSATSTPSPSSSSTPPTRRRATPGILVAGAWSSTLSWWEFTCDNALGSSRTARKVGPRARPPRRRRSRSPRSSGPARRRRARLRLSTTTRPPSPLYINLNSGPHGKLRIYVARAVRGSRRRRGHGLASGKRVVVWNQSC